MRSWGDCEKVNITDNVKIFCIIEGVMNISCVFL